MIAKKARFHIFVVHAIIGVVATTCAFLFIALTIVSNAEKKLENRIYPGVIIDNISFGNKTKQEIVDYFDKKNERLKTVSFTIIYDRTPIATLSAQNLHVHFDSKGIADRAFIIGRTPNLLSRLYQKIVTIFGLQQFSFPASVEYDNARLSEFVSDQEEKYNMPAKNALFSFVHGRVVSFRIEEKGRQIDSDNFLSDFSTKITTLAQKPTNQIIQLTSHVILPEITLAKVNDFGIEELIAIGKSDYNHSIPGRIHNVILAASKFNGVLIPKDAVLSFNDTVGDISQTTGYEQAYIIKSGKTVLGDGGGVCQVSTTLFRAALNAGLPIVERTAHAYRVGYYENDSKPGFDATVFAPSVDLKIKNDTHAYILIQTEVDKENNLLYFKLYGKKDDRKVEISPVVVSDLQEPPPPLYQDDATLKKGITKQIDFAAWGSKAYFNYKVTKSNTVSFAKTFYSNYRPWQAIFLVGKAD